MSVKSKPKPKVLLLVLLSALCLVVWSRNIRLIQGGSHAQLTANSTKLLIPPQVKLPDSDDFKLASRDPFTTTQLRPLAPPQHIVPSEPKKPVLLPYVLVGIVGSIKTGNATALVRDESTGNVIMVAVRDSLMGYKLDHMSSDTLHLSSSDGKAIVLAQRMP